MTYELGTAILMVAIIWVFRSWAIQLDNQHASLKVMFFGISMWLSVAAMGIVLNMASEASASVALQNLMERFFQVTIFVGGYLTTLWIVYTLLFRVIMMYKELLVKRQGGPI